MKKLRALMIFFLVMFFLGFVGGFLGRVAYENAGSIFKIQRPVWIISHK